MASSRKPDEKLENDDFGKNDVFDVRSYLKRAVDEYNEEKHRYDELLKKCDDMKAAAAGIDISDLNEEKAADGGKKIDEAVHDADKFLEELPLKSKLEELRQLYELRSYLTTVRRVFTIGDQLKSALESGDWTTFVHVLTKELNDDIARKLSQSSDPNFRVWISRYIDIWRRHGSARISALIVKRLESAHIPQDVLHADKRLSQELNPLIQALYDISSSDSKETDQFAIVAQVILRPFAKRFIHHFCGGTEEIAPSASTKPLQVKPEWYLSIVLKWHRQFTPWIERFTATGDKNVAANAEDEASEFGSILGLHFARGLVELARRRLKADLLHCAQDDTGLLPHLIDEAIAFDTDMKSANYPENDPACIDVLTEAGIFEIWAQLEQTEASKCMEVFLNEPEAWMLRYGDGTVRTNDVECVDANKVPFVTDNILLLLTAMKHRFRMVRSQEHRRMFVQIQCQLLHEFREHLAELSQKLRSPISSVPTNSKKQRSSPTFAHLVNTCSYVCSVLTEWQESPAYLAIRVGCFDEAIELFDHKRRSLLRDGCSAVLNDLTPAADEYRRSFAFFTGRGDIGLSGQATAFLYAPLQEAMSILNQTLNKKNFLAFTRQMAAGLQKMFIERIILELRLDHKSGEELQRHLGVAFVKVVFDNYGIFGASAYFNRLTQYLHVVSMNAGNCTLLKESLKERRGSGEHVLNEMGIENLSVQEVEDLLQRRSDLM